MSHVCAKCDGEGWVFVERDRFDAGDPPIAIQREVDCSSCDGTGDCDGPTDNNGDCTRCGWSYSGPDETPTGNGPAEEAHRMELARRLK